MIHSVKILPDTSVQRWSQAGWTWNPHDERFVRNCRALRDFVEQTGGLPRQKEDDPAVAALGRWVAAQRSERQGPKTAERRQMLEQIPGWTWHPRDEAWAEMLDRVRAYAEKYGRVPPVKEKSDLSVWVMLQRSYNRKGWLNEEKRRKLEAIPGRFWGEGRP